MGVGGSIESVSLSGRYFAVAADAESNRKLGGSENEVQANGDRSARLIKTITPFKLDGLTLDVDDLNGDQEFLQELADRNDFFSINITYASGSIYQGSAQITDELQYSNSNATASVTLEGTATLTKQ